MNKVITYTGRNFSKIKEQLINYAKNYFPDTYTDFTPTSPGMMFIEMAAYVGDILSFYQDRQLQETFLQYAQDPKGLYSLAYMMGYRPKTTTVSTVELTLSQEVGVVITNEGYQPNWTEAVKVDEGAVAISNLQKGQSFITENPVDFRFSSSLDPTEVEAIYLEDDSEEPSGFVLRKKVKAYSGTIKTVSKTFGSYQKYPTFEIEDTNIVGVLDIQESEDLTEEGRWVEVPFLGQDTVFKEVVNTEENQGTVPYVLTLQKVPKRFVTRFLPTGNLEVQFGSGIYADDRDEANFLPNPISLERTEQETPEGNKFDVAYDPSNFLFSKSYGLVPINKTLNIRYITGGGVESNVPAGTITLLGPGFPQNVQLSVINEVAAVGGRDGDSLEEIRENALRSFGEQKRVVTLEDFNVRALGMPTRFGVVAKVYAAKDMLFSGDEKDPLNVSVYLLSYGEDGHLVQASPTLKSNLRTYLSEYTMLTDTVDLKDAYIINIGIQYDIVLRQGYGSLDVLLACNSVLREYFHTKNRAINEVINLVDVQNLLNQVQGVQVVKDLKVINKVGQEGELQYSNYSYDISAATRNGIVYPSYDISFFEVKYPELDIEGRIVTM